MSFELKLPNIGEGVNEADIADILVSVGDVVEPNQAVFELETEKAVVELPCPEGGTVEKIHVKAGDTIKIGDLLITLGGGSTAKAEVKETKKDDGGAAAPESAKASSTKESKPEAVEEAETELVGGTVEFTLPNLGEGVTSADVADVLVSEGDVIEANTPVLELETEKAVVEAPCPHAGKIKKIHVKSGDSLNVGDVVLTIETSSKVAGSGKKTTPPASETSSSEKKADVKSSGSAEPVKSEPKSESTSALPVRPDSKIEEKAESGEPAPAAPSTRRLARQLGVDLKAVAGTGSGGRITHDDVQAYVRDRLQKSNSLPAKSAPAQVQSGGPLAPPPLPDFSRFGVVEREKLNKIARTAAENLTVAWQVIPHVTHHDLVDITDIENARKRFSAGVGKNGPKVTMTAIVMKALAKCLQIYPKFNSSLDPETHEIVYKKFYNIGCAVDTPNGLLVPVVKDCDKKNILDIALTINDLAAKARDRKLPVDAMQGATCTVTNLGGIGGVGFTPIVNYPEVCILGMARGQQELKLIDGKVEERLMLPLSLSYDHRVINGADAARFVSTLGNMLADPFQLLTTV